MSGAVGLADVVAARDRLRGVLRPTPTGAADALGRVVGRPVHLKPEHLQRTGSFKIRGAANLISRLPAGTAVVAGSAGNHAQGVALAASLTGRPCRVYMPRLASLPKLAATRGYGATVVQVHGGVDECIAAARDDATRTGAVFVPPFDDPLIVAGQGTIGLEIVEEVSDPEVVLVPVGGGGLLAGIAVALANRPAVRVVGVEAVGACAMSRSLAAGEPVEVTPRTMADGVALRRPGALPFALVRDVVDEIVQVSEEEISAALLMLMERSKAVVEPAGALGVAALLAGKIGGTGPAVAVLSGGNSDPLLLTRLIDHGLSAQGRFFSLRVVVEDEPGSLHRLTGVVADVGANLLAVEHRREGIDLPLATAAVTLTVETRDHAHQRELVRALAAAGYPVASE